MFNVAPSRQLFSGTSLVQKRATLASLISFAIMPWEAWSVLVALLTLIVGQAWQIYDVRRKERRITAKLALFYICESTPQKEEDLIGEYERRDLKGRIKKDELRKALYEMLADETLRYRSNGTYYVRRNRALDNQHE
jgi:hypothetical protein